MEIDSILRPKITRDHIALVKGWVNGVDLSDLASRYLASFAYDIRAFDLRKAKSTLMVVLKEMAIIGARNNINGSSALLRQAKRIKVDPAPPQESDASGPVSFESYCAGCRGLRSSAPKNFWSPITTSTRTLARSAMNRRMNWLSRGAAA